MNKAAKYMTRAGLCLAMLLSVVITGFPATAYADVNNFTVTDFTADYYLGTDDKQGSLAINEKIAVDFNDFNHGILRALPERYEGQKLGVHVQEVKRDGKTEEFSTYGSNGNKVLKIGDPNYTITGPHTYEIHYSMANVIRFTKDSDVLIWNTNGTGWNQFFLNVTARLHVPATLASKFQGATCYTGAYRSTGQDCTVSTSGDTTTFQSNRHLAPGETMTFSGDFPSGTFSRPTPVDWLLDHLGAILQLLLLPLVVFVFAYRYWYRHGKDIKGRGTIVPEYGPPDDLAAAEADAINNYGLGKNAISATIIDLAIRKYLRIIEGDSKGVLGIGKHKTYSFQKLPAPAGGVLKPFEGVIYADLFPSGDTTEISDLKAKFYKTARAIQKDVPASLTAQGYFSRDPKKVGGFMLGLAFTIFFLSWYLFSADWALAVGLILSAAILALFAKLMPRRTQKGADAKDALAGLKLYMETAEKDRIAMLQSPNAPYAERSDPGSQNQAADAADGIPSAPSGPPQRTVHLFEKLLPYAMIMGVEKEWAKQFQDIYTTPPDWYAGNWASFNAGYLVGSLNSSMAAMNTSFAAPASSSSGSGGGFSGGGGGGGGGGGW